MKTVFKARDGREFESEQECSAYEKKMLAEYREKHMEDFKFMVLCHAKGNVAMYELLRDRSLIKSVWKN